MSNATFTASDVFSKINLPFSDGFNQNAVVEYLTEYFGDHEYSSVDDMVRDLQMAHYSAGSLGMIYTYELEDFISGNIGAIEEVLDYYMECTGEDITVQSISGMLVIALDVAVHEIASAIEYADLAIVANHADYMDTNPEVIITDTNEAYDIRNEIIIARLDMEVQHSTQTVTQEDLDAMEETLNELVYVVD